MRWQSIATRRNICKIRVTERAEQLKLKMLNAERSIDFKKIKPDSSAEKIKDKKCISRITS